MRHIMKWLTAGILTTVLCLCMAVNVMAKSASTNMNVQLRVKPYLSLTVNNTVSAVTVTQANITAGYIDLPLATTVTTTTNSTNGYVLSVLLRSVTYGVLQVYPSGTVTVDGVTYNLMPGVYTSVTIPYSGSPTLTKTLSYRFNLNPALVSGTYPWPITITASPL